MNENVKTRIETVQKEVVTYTTQIKDVPRYFVTCPICNETEWEFYVNPLDLPYEVKCSKCREIEARNKAMNELGFLINAQIIDLVFDGIYFDSIKVIDSNGIEHTVGIRADNEEDLE